MLTVVAKMVLNDFLRGKIPWYLPDPSWPERKGKEDDVEFVGREGRLGELRLKKGEAAGTEAGMEENGEDSDGGSWDGLDVETDEDGNDEDDIVSDDDEEDDEDEEEEEEDESVEDPRPPKKARR